MEESDILEPMTETSTAGDDHKGSGRRKRAGGCAGCGSQEQEEKEEEREWQWERTYTVLGEESAAEHDRGGLRPRGGHGALTPRGHLHPSGKRHLPHLTPGQMRAQTEAAPR